MATNDKYDRQLRLWGAKGQKALGETLVILVGASAAGTETLKNLVLPGIGSFCVVDDHATVTKHDVASNFFVPAAAAVAGGNSRAQVASQHLQELNEDVQGSFQHLKTLSNITDWKATVFDKNNTEKKKLLVIASDLEPKALESLSQACDDDKIPLIVVHSYGLIGVVRLQLSGQIPLLDPKPTNAPPDLRLKTSFPGLDQMAQSIDLHTLESHQSGHVPYPIILYQCLAEWKQGHDGKCPNSFAEKQEFKGCIQRKSADYDKQVNFQEAVQNSYLAYTERDVMIPEQLDPSSTLGVLYQALEAFQKRHDGRPPLNGSIPDMTADTDSYIRLQQVYKDQAEQDVKEMLQLSRSTSSGVIIEDDDVTTFCANVYTVGQISTRSLVQEFQESPTGELLDDLRMALMDPYEVPEHTPLLWYMGIRACQVFCQHQGRYPGTMDDWESDVPGLVDCWNRVVAHYQLGDQDLLQQHASNICQELTRYANAEIHTVASVVGGVASQEAVKIITGQYIPLDNTYVFNGIVAVGGVYRF